MNRDAKRMWIWFLQQATHDAEHAAINLRKYQETGDLYYLDVAQSFAQGWLADIAQLEYWDDRAEDWQTWRQPSRMA